jgi:hypothetical protein
MTNHKMKKLLITLATIGTIGMTSAFAQDEEEIIVVPNGGGNGGNNGGIAVPEAVSTIGILGLGLVGLAAARRRFRK